MRSGKMMHNGQLQSPTVTRGAGGSFANSWGTIRTCYAQIVPKNGTETFFSDAIRAEMTHTLTMRVGATRVTPRMRFLWQSRYFNIIAAAEVGEEGVQLKIAAVENLDVTESGSAVSSVDFEYNTGQLDFLQTALTNTVTYDPVTDRKIYVDSVEIVCTALTGVIVTQPSLSLGITGTVTKYLNKAATTQLTAANTRQFYDVMSADNGEGDLVVRAGDASGPSVYTGCVIVRGRLVG